MVFRLLRPLCGLAMTAYGLLAMTVVAYPIENPYKTYTKVLDNGASIVTRYVPDSKLVSIEIRFLSGLSNEGEYAGSGISHFLEHILFKGTNDLNADQILEKVRSMGALINASTGIDSAEFYITVPRENFEEAFSLLTRMVMECVFTDDGFSKERDVILKEMNLYKDDPERETARKLFETAYAEHIYKYPVTGYTERFEKLTKDDLINYHMKTYTPDRMAVGISGGVDPDLAIKTAEKNLKDYKRGEPWFGSGSPEPRQIEKRTANIYHDTNLAYFAISFHTVSLYSDDLYAVDVLSTMLGGGRDSALYKKLVRDTELLLSVSSSSLTPRYPGLFIISGLGETQNIEKAITDIFSAIEEFKASPIKDDALTRAKNIVQANFLYSNESVEEMASSIARSELFTASPFFDEKYVEEINKVTKDNVKNVIVKYLNKNNATVVTLLPLDMENKEAGVTTIQGSSAGTGLQENEQNADLNEKFVTFENGLKVIIKKRPALNIVASSITFPGGLMAQTPSENGIAGLTSSLLLKGTKKLTEEKIVPAFEAMGGSINSFSGNNSSGISMKVLSKDFDSALPIFADCVMNSSFSRDEIDKQKKKMIGLIKSDEKNIFQEGLFFTRKILYGVHPYAMRPAGDIDAINGITMMDIAKFYKENFAPDKAVLAIVGDIDIDETLKKVYKEFKPWAGKARELADLSVNPIQGVLKEDFYMRREQSLVLLGFQGVDIYDAKKYTLAIISDMLSDNGGILFNAVREDKGLAYMTGANSVPLVDRGYFIVYVNTTEENIDESKRLVFEVIDRLKNGDFTNEMMEASKNRLITDHAIGLEDNLSISNVMALDELYNLGYNNYTKYHDMIKNVTGVDIINTAKEIFSQDNYALVTIHSNK